MNILKTKYFSFRTQFDIYEVPFQMQISSDKVEKDDMIMAGEAGYHPQDWGDNG